MEYNIVRKIKGDIDMIKKKYMLVGFAVFVTMLLLMTPCIAKPIQESKTIDAVERETVNDNVENDCSLCADAISSELAVIQQELEYFEENGLIPDELSGEVLEIQEMISGPSPTIDCRGLLQLIMILYLFALVYNSLAFHALIKSLLDTYEENCS